MRELKGEADLQLAKDVLCAFEEAHYSSPETCSDIQEGLYWSESEDEHYSADLGMLLRGECEDVRIFECEDMDGWFRNILAWNLAAFVKFNNKLYFFYI